MLNYAFFGFNFFNIIFTLMFLLIFATFIFVFSNIIKQYRKDSKSPVLTVHAIIVTKRTHYRKRSNSMHSTSSYYVTFEVDSKDRLELHVPSDEYGYLIEGDDGLLTFQGSRFLKFERKI